MKRLSKIPPFILLIVVVALSVCIVGLTLTFLNQQTTDTYADSNSVSFGKTTQEFVQYDANGEKTDPFVLDIMAAVAVPINGTRSDYTLVVKPQKLVTSEKTIVGGTSPDNVLIRIVTSEYFEEPDPQFIALELYSQSLEIGTVNRIPLHVENYQMYEDSDLYAVLYVDVNSLESDCDDYYYVINGRMMGESHFYTRLWSMDDLSYHWMFTPGTIDMHVN